MECGGSLSRETVMLRHGLAFTIVALVGALLTMPESSLARGAGFRPAFTGGPFRIVLPRGRPNLAGRPGPHRVGKTPSPSIGASHPVPPATGPEHPTAGVVADGTHHFRFLRYRRFGNSLYPVTVGTDSSFYGTLYDPSDDVPVYAPPALLGADDPFGPANTLSRQVQAPGQPRGCRAERVIVPSATGAGEGNVTIVRC